MNSPRNRQRLIGDPYLNPLCMHWGTMKVIFTSSSSNRWWFKKVQGRLRNSYTGWSKCQEGQISEALQWPSEVAKTKASPYPCQRCRCFAVNRNIKEISGTPDATPLCSALHIIYSLPIHYFQVCPPPLGFAFGRQVRRTPRRAGERQRRNWHKGHSLKSACG